MKWISAIVILLVISAAAYGAVWYMHRDNGNETAFRTAPVARGDLLATITATGTLEPTESIDVGAQVQGRIIKFGTDKNGKEVDNNSEVTQGSTLAWIDPSVYQSEVDQAQAQLAQAKAGVLRAQADLEQMKAGLTKAERDWERAKRLGPSDALSQADYDAAESAYETAKANIGVGQAAIDQAKATVTDNEAALTRAQQNLSYCTIPSPVNGVIITRRVNIGQTVVSSLSAPSLFLIAKDLTHMKIWTAVNEADIGNIHEGQDVTFTVDAYGNRKFKGKVSKVRLDAQMTQNVVTYTVEIATDNLDRALIPYMTANVSFQVAKKQNALLVPNAALRWSPSDANQVAPDAREEAENAGGESSGGRAQRQRETGAAGGAGATPGAEASAGGAPTSRPSRHEHAAGGEQHTRGTVWVQDGPFVRPVQLHLGVTDNINTEVVSGDIKEGEQLVIGEAIPGSSDSGDARNPFAPQFRRRGSGGSRGH